MALQRSHGRWIGTRKEPWNKQHCRQPCVGSREPVATPCSEFFLFAQFAGCASEMRAEFGVLCPVMLSSRPVTHGRPDAGQGDFSGK